MAIRVKVVPVSETITADTPATTVANNVVMLRQSLLQMPRVQQLLY